MHLKKQMARRGAYRASNFALLHRPQCLGDRIANLDTAFFKLLSGGAQPRVFFDA